MAIDLTRLPRTQFSGLEYENIIDDIVRLVKDNPSYNENWDDFLSSNAGRMLIELFAYIADQLATRIDWMVNENFIGTATQKKSVLRILKLIGYNFSLPYASRVEVSVTADRPLGTFYISQQYSAEDPELDFFTLTARDRNGVIRNFEAIQYDDVNSRFDYKSGFQLETGSAASPNLLSVIEFHEGQSVFDTFTIETDNNPVLAIRNNPVTENSIRVYREINTGEGIGEEELLLVSSFLTPEAQREEDTFGEPYPLPYVINVQEDNTVEIEFPSTDLIPNVARRPRIGDKIRIFYRVGGGLNGNITSRSINTSRRVVVNNDSINLTFLNELEATGGRNGETADEAAAKAPLEIRTAGKAVTREDYEIILNSENTILKAASYGNANLPSTLFSLYGEGIKPLEVWNYILVNKPGWDLINPTEYKDFQWMQLRLENRFNNLYAFKDGNFNELLQVIGVFFRTNEDINWDGTGSYTFKNFALIDTSANFKNSLFDDTGSFNSDLRIKISVEEIPVEYYDEIYLRNYFFEDWATNNGEIEVSGSNYQIFQKIHARHLSTQDIAENVIVSAIGNRYIKLGFDNRTVFEIDLNALSSGSNTASDLVGVINAQFSAHADYNNGQAITTTKGSQELGLSVDTSAESGLLINTDYYFRVNETQYSFNTGDFPVKTYAEVVGLMKEAMAINITGDLKNGSDTITNIVAGRYLERIKKGMTITGTNVPSGTSTITEVNTLENTITMSGSVVITTDEVDLTIYPFEVEINGTSPNEDVIITNLKEEPFGPVWVEDGQYSVSSQNLLTAFVATPDAPTTIVGVAGYQDVGINGVINNSTSGYQAFSTTTMPSILNGTNDYEFDVDIDGAGPTTITVSLVEASDTLSSVATKIDTELTGATCAVDDLGRIRITSESTGSSSSIEITATDPIVTNDFFTTFTGSEAFYNPSIAGVSAPAGALHGLDNNVEYDFKINGYNFVIDTGVGQTINSLISLINTEISESGIYTATLQDDGLWNEDIRITSSVNAWVELEPGESNDLFSAITGIIRLDETEQVTTEEWSSYDSPVGGGDYSNVAKALSADGQLEEYIYLESPSRGEWASLITFEYPESTSASAENAMETLFGIILSDTSDPAISYGYNRATLIKNLSSNTLGDIILEVGTTYFDKFKSGGAFQSYLNYLSSNTNEITLGRYYTDNFTSDDPSYRPPANRIYNTSYDLQGNIDIENSNFVLKFTREETGSNSIYTINSDWDLQLSEASQIESVADPQNSVNSSNYNIRVSIDGIGFIELDVTGDAGVSAGGNGYLIEDLIDNINASIQAGANYTGSELYSSYDYASIDITGTKIILKSPLNTNDSSITFEPPGSNDATDDIFGLSIANPSYSHVIRPTGDYYIEYDSRTITADFTANSQWLADISSSDMLKVFVGMRVFSIANLIPESRVIEVDNSASRIKVNNVSSLSTNNQIVNLSLDLMKINKINNVESPSKLPDLKFYLHYIFDRRYVEGAYDGAVINNTKRPGTPLGQLDEDIYTDILSTKKVLAVENVFKETVFTTFDIEGTVYHERLFAASDVQNRVEQSLKNEYGLELRDYGQPITKSKIMDTIHSNEGVEYVEITYLGPNAQASETSQDNTISASFDEIIVLSEDVLVAGNKTHGIIFNYKVIGT